MKLEDLTEKEITDIQEMIKANNKGWFYNSKIVTDTYNKLLNKKLPSTNCGTCIKKRIKSIETIYKKLLQDAKKEEDGGGNEAGATQEANQA